MSVLNLTEDFGLTEGGFKVFEVINWRQKASINDEARNYEDVRLLAYLFAMRRF